MGIFKSKPGGTFLGNIIRGAANKFSGGVLGNGQMLAQAQGLPPVSAVNMDAIKNGAFDAIGAAVDKNPEMKKAIASTVWDKYKLYILGAVAAIVAITIFLVTRKKKHSAPKRRF